MTAKVSPAPSLEALLEKRGVKKDSTFHDYQDYILQREAELKPRLFRRGILSEGSMHLALNRIISVKNFFR